MLGYDILRKRKPVRELLEQAKSSDRGTPIHRLLNLSTKLFQNKDLKADDYLNLIQILSLLENVYRNALLRPYIPAYRTINSNCGRYRSFLEPLKYHLLQQLNFQNDPLNLHTYMESNELEIIKCAFICGILINRYSQYYQESLGSSSGKR